MNNVAITGRGIISPIGNNIEEFEAGLDAGTVPFKMTEWSNPAEGKVSWTAPVTGFTPEGWMSERVIEGTARDVQFGIAAAVQAVNESGLELAPMRTGVVVGTTVAGLREVAEAQRAYDTGGPEAVPPKLLLRVYGFYCAGQIAMRWGLHGPIMTLDHACAAGLDAIGQGARLIEMGEADVIVAVGTGATGPDVLRYSRFAPPRVGPRTDMERASDPLRYCMPFDVDRINLVGAEGAAALVLERADQAKSRGAHVFAYVKGYAALADAYHATAPEPSGQFEALAMRRAQENAGVDSTAVDALIAHGTSTIKGDMAELYAINSVFHDRPSPLPVTSTKGQLGHMGGGSGPASVLAGLHCMQAGKFVPTANTRNVESDAEFRLITGSPLDVPIQLLQVNAFGFGGHNSSLIVSRGS